MSIQTEQSYSWLKKIPGELFSLDQTPLWGNSPDFSFEKFSNEMSLTLQAVNLKIDLKNTEWRDSEALDEGLGQKIIATNFTVGPVEGNISWLIPEQSLLQFMYLILGNEGFNTSETYVDEDFIRASSQFLSLEAIGAFQKIDFDKKLVPIAIQSMNYPKESCLCLDIAISFKDKTFYGRLCLSATFRKSWAQYYIEKQKQIKSSLMEESLSVIIQVEACKIHLKTSECRQLSIGDFLLVDSSSLEPYESKGRVMLVINELPCFRGKIKLGQLKILEHPLYHEVDKFMVNPPKKEETKAPEDSFDDKDFENDDFDFDLDETKPEKKELLKTVNEDDDEDDFDDEDNETVKPLAAKKKNELAAEKTSEEIKAEKSLSVLIDDIPLPVVIEVGRIQMSVKKLLELQPGNMLDLDIHPESSVDMVVNGKRIARGQLLRIGDVLGIRIIELS